ncbi:MAG: DNA alkylation repair protein [Balneolaceae bacterium]
MLNAEEFIKTLKSYQSEKEYRKIERYFQEDDEDNRIIGVRMKMIFDLASDNREMPLDEVEKLLGAPWYEARMGAVSIMDFRVRSKQTPPELRKQLFDLYIDRHDRINTWDFVDRSAPRVVGGYLYELGKPRDILYRLARSDNPWERRTAIVSTGYFIRNGELDDTFQIAELLLNDDHELVQKAVGTFLRHAGKQDPERLHSFLETHAAGMPRTMLTIAMEKLDKKQRAYYRSLKE